MFEEDIDIPLNSDAAEHDDGSDLELLKAIRERKADAWAVFVEKYQGRLMNFAISKLHQQADAEDVIQDTFVSFIKGLDSFRGQSSLENYLFTILRNKIISRYRSKSAETVSLIQDIYNIGQGENQPDAITQIPSDSLSQSRIGINTEQRHIQEQIFARSLLQLRQSFKGSTKFRNLKILELLLYCRLSTSTTAALLKVEETTVRVFKHRCLKQLHENIESFNTTIDFTNMNLEDILKETWEVRRLTCPKRSTIGAFLLEQLDPEWFDYIDFHLTILGCHFCRANLKDLIQKNSLREQQFRDKIMASTIGFLNNP
jgi:RNA polymerase sigma factor (sigma-70 family)